MKKKCPICGYKAKLIKKFKNVWDEERSEYKCKSKKCGCRFIPAKESPYEKMMSKEEKKYLYVVSGIPLELLEKDDKNEENIKEV